MPENDPCSIPEPDEPCEPENNCEECEPDGTQPSGSKTPALSGGAYNGGFGGGGYGGGHGPKPNLNLSGMGKAAASTLLSSGQFTWQLPLLSIPALGGQGWSFKLKYLSDTNFNSMLGPGFGYPQYAYIEELIGGEILLHKGDDTESTFLPAGGDTYSSAAGNGMSVLVRENTDTANEQFVLKRSDGTCTTFFGFESNIGTPGQMKNQCDRYGNAITYDWMDLNGDVRLTRVTDSYGREINYSYETCGSSMLKQIEDFFGRRLNFQYDSHDRLTAVVLPSIERAAEDNAFPGGTAYVFAYSGARISKIFYPNQTQPFLDDSTRTVDVAQVYATTTPRYTVTYNGNGEVTSETIGDPDAEVGGTYSYAYDTTGPFPSNLIDPADSIVRSCTMTDRNGNMTIYYFNVADMTVRTDVLRNRDKLNVDGINDLTAYTTWMKYNFQNQKIAVVYPEGNSVEYTYDDGMVDFGSGTELYARRRGLKLSETYFSGNTLGIPSRTGSNGQVELTRRYFYEPIYNQVCAVIEERGNPVDGSSYWTPQNGGATPTDGDRSRFATLTYFDYQQNQSGSIANDPEIQALLGLSASDISDLLDHVNDQMIAGGLPDGFQTDLGDINGDGTGNGNGSGLPASPMLGNRVKIRHPQVRQLAENSDYPGSGDPWEWQQQTRVETFTYNLRGQMTTQTDPEGNLMVFVRYPESDPEGNGQYINPEKSNKQYGRVKETHLDANPDDVMSLLGEDADLMDFVPGIITRTNTPGSYLDLTTRHESSANSGCATCAYDALGNPLSVTDARGFTTTYDRNEMGEVYRTISAAPYHYTTETYYDSNRNVIRVDVEDKRVAFDSFDPTDARFAHLTPSGSNGAANEPVACACESGEGGGIRPGWFTNLYSYDLLDDRIEENLDATGSDPDRLVTIYDYDANQNLIQITHPEGNTVMYDYDERNLRIAELVGAATLSTDVAPDPLPSSTFAPDAALTLYSYDDNGNLINVISPSDRDPGDSCSLTAVIDNAFDTGVNVTHTGDWVTENTYDGFDRLISTKDAVGNISVSDYDPVGNIVATRQFGPARNSSPTDRDGTDHVTLASAAIRYDEASRAYEQQQDVFLVTDSTGGSVVSSALPSARTATHTGGGLEANATTNGHTTTATLTSGESSYVLTRTVYDRADRVTATAQDNAAVSHSVYDGAGRVIESTDALGNTVAYTYDNNGNTTGVTRTELCTLDGPQTIEPEIFRSLSRYDSHNRLIASIEQGADGEISNDLETCCAWPVASSSIVTLLGYDSRNNLTLVIDPRKNTTVGVYDGASRIIRVDQHLRQLGLGDQPPATGSSFQANGRACITTTALYDGNSRIVRLIDDRGSVTTFAYDDLDRQIQVIFHDGSTRTTNYNFASDIIFYSDESQNAFTYDYDALGRRRSASISLAPNVEGTTGQSYVYDGLSRIIETTDTVGTTDADADSYFDSLSRTLEEAQVYDATGGGSTHYVTHEAWTSYLSTGFTFPQGRQITYGYDALYRKNLIDEASGGSGASTAKWDFFGPSRIAELTLGNGLICSHMNNTRTRSAVQQNLSVPGWGDYASDRLGYDGAGRMTTKRYLNSTINSTTGAYDDPGALVVGFTTAYDKASNKRYDRALHAESRSFLYQPIDGSGLPVQTQGMVASGFDSTNRLRQYQRGVLAPPQPGYPADSLSAGGGRSIQTPIALPGTDRVRDYDLDGLSNWKSTDFTPVGGAATTEKRDHNYLSQITRTLEGANKTPLAYDGSPSNSNGNLIDDGTRLFAYDAFNRVTTVKRQSDDQTIGQYVYDAFGRRIRRTISNGGLSGNISNGTNNCFYNMWQVVEEHDDADTPRIQFVWGHYIDELVQQRNDVSSTPADRYPLGDMRYTAAALTDASASLVEVYDVDPYGNTLIFNAAGAGGNWWADDASTTDTATTPYLYTSRRYDPETKLYYFRARTFHPQLGRFLQRDPIGYQDGMNLYAGYFAIEFGVDPTGEKRCQRDPHGVRYRWQFKESKVLMKHELTVSQIASILALNPNFSEAAKATIELTAETIEQFDIDDTIASEVSWEAWNPNTAYGTSLFDNAIQGIHIACKCIFEQEIGKKYICCGPFPWSRPYTEFRWAGTGRKVEVPGVMRQRGFHKDNSQWRCSCEK